METFRLSERRVDIPPGFDDFALGQDLHLAGIRAQQAGNQLNLDRVSQAPIQHNWTPFQKLRPLIEGEVGYSHWLLGTSRLFMACPLRSLELEINEWNRIGRAQAAQQQGQCCIGRHSHRNASLRNLTT
jgi:hypothetical protein